MRSLLSQRWLGACLALLLGSISSLAGQAAAPPAARLTPITAPTESGYLGLIGDDRMTGGRGVQVLSVRGRGAAEAAGVRTGDVVMAINRQPVNTVVQLAQQLAGVPAGAKIEIEFERGGKRYAVTATLGPRPAVDGAPLAPPLAPGPTTALLPTTPAASKPTLGVRVISPLEGARRGYVVYVRQGAMIEHIEPGSPADRYGLSLGAVIVAIDGKRVDDAVDLANSVAAVRAGDPTEVTFYRGDKLFRKQMRLTPVATQPPLTESPLGIRPKVTEFPPEVPVPPRPRVPPPPPRPAAELPDAPPMDSGPDVVPKGALNPLPAPAGPERVPLDPLLPPPAPAKDPAPTDPLLPPPAPAKDPAPTDPLLPPPPVKAPIAPPVAAPADPLIVAKPPVPAANPLPANPLPPSVVELDRKLTDPPAAKPPTELARLKADLADTVHRITALQKEQQALFKSLESLQKAIDELEKGSEK